MKPQYGPLRRAPTRTALRRLVAGAAASAPVSLGQAVIAGARRGLEVARTARRGVLTLTPARGSTSRALVVADPTPLRDAQPRRVIIPSVVMLVHALRDLGYTVDVVGNAGAASVPAQPYTSCIGTRSALAAARILPRGCRTVLLADTVDVLAQNVAELDRLVELKDRRGVVLAPVRYERSAQLVDPPDAIIVVGNDITLSAYDHGGKTLHAVPAAADLDRPSPAGKDLVRLGGRFLWIGDRGLVHQGLHLVLEAFAGLPTCELTVCGPVDAEPGFRAAFSRELYAAPNIRTVGDIDPGSARFAEIADGAAAFILPAALQAQSATAVATMQAGLIPIVSRECGLDVDDFGLVLDDCTAAAIRSAVGHVGALPPTRRLEMAVRAWEVGRARHRPAPVVARYREALRSLLRPAPVTG